MLGRHVLELFNEKADGTLLVAGDLGSQSPVAASRALLTKDVDAFLTDDVFAPDVFSKVEADRGRLKDDKLALVSIPKCSFQDAHGELFRRAVLVVTTWISLDRDEVFEVVDAKGAERVLSLGVACVANDVLGIIIEIPVNLWGEYVIRVVTEIRGDYGCDRPGRNFVDQVIFTIGAQVDLARGPSKSLVDRV